MKILLITRSFYPIISPRSFRATELAKEFSKQGHQVKVVTFRNSEHPAFAAEHGIDFGYMKALSWKNVNTTGNPLASRIKRVIKRGFNLAIEYPDVQIVGRIKDYIKQETGKYDALISIAAPHSIHWGVAASNWKRIAKVWIADCGDPYFGDTSDTFKKLFYFKYIEKWAFKKMDKIIIPFEEAKNAYFAEFHSKMHIIPQGFDFNIAKEPYTPNKIPTFLFAGSLSLKYRDPTELLDYLTFINKDFKFIIYTRNHNVIKPYLKQLNGKIELHQYIPREQLMREMSKVDFLVNIDNPNETQSPSKLIDYGIASRPILNIKPNKLDKRIVEEFLEGNYSNQYKLNNIDRYDIKNVAKQFIELIKK